MAGDISRRDAVILAGGALVGAGAGGMPATAAASEARLSCPDFRGKTVVVYGHGRAFYTPVVLSGCSFEVQGGRLFLVGRDQQSGSQPSWSNGARRAIAWEAVEDYLVFDSHQEYLARLPQPELDDDIPF
jgi:hypothetical protein